MMLVLCSYGAPVELLHCSHGAPTEFLRTAPDHRDGRWRNLAKFWGVFSLENEIR